MIDYTFGINALAAFVVIGAISYAYLGENKWYRIIEHAVIALSIGILTVASTQRLVENGITPFMEGNYWLIVPIIIGLLTYTQYSRTYSWISRLCMGWITGIALGVNVRMVPFANFISVVRTLALPLAGTPLEIINSLVMAVAGITTLWFFTFTFTRLHTGPLRSVARTGRFFLMFGLGAMFAISLAANAQNIITITNLILRDWLQVIG